MKFRSSGFFGNLTDITGIHTASRHDDDPSVGLFHQFFQKRDSLFGGSFLSGSKNPVYTQSDNLFQGLFGIAAHIKSTVEGDTHLAYRIHQFLHQRHIDIAFCGKTAEYHTVRTQLACHFNIMQHDFLFNRRI